MNETNTKPVICFICGTSSQDSGKIYFTLDEKGQLIVHCGHSWVYQGESA